MGALWREMLKRPELPHAGEGMNAPGRLQGLAGA